MYQLPDRPKERNLDFLTGYHYRLKYLYNYENLWDDQKPRSHAENFIDFFKDVLPNIKDDEAEYHKILGELWACHGYLEGDEE